MGRFYFHLRAGDELIRDDVGEELPDMTAARCEARLVARELLAEAIKSGKAEVADSVVIADEAGRALAIVPLATVLPKLWVAEGVRANSDISLPGAGPQEGASDRAPFSATRIIRARSDLR
jgi:hypothetical protein